MKKILIGLLILSSVSINIINAQVIKGDITTQMGSSNGPIPDDGKFIFDLFKMEMKVLDKQKHQIKYHNIKATDKPTIKENIKIYTFSFNTVEKQYHQTV